MRDLTFLCVLLLAATSPAAAQDPLPARVTLDEALARAAANSHRLGELRARESAAGALLDQRRAADMPIVSAQAGYQRTNHVDPYGFVQNGRLQVLYPDVPDNWRARLDMQWPIYTGGRTKALEQAATAEHNATGKDLESARADLRLETTRAFWALVTATESVSVVGESVKRIEAQLGDVRARFDAGFLPPNDVLTVDSRVSQQRTLLIQARNLRDGARAELARLMGAPVDADFEVDAVLAEAPPSPTASARPASPPGSAQSQIERADREALALRAEAAESRIAAARADNKPSVAVIAGYDYARPNPRIFPREDVWEDSWDLGVNVSFTLWNGGRTGSPGRRGAASGRGRARAPGRGRHADRARDPPAPARSRVGAFASRNRQRRRRQRHRGPPRRRRALWGRCGDEHGLA